MDLPALELLLPPARPQRPIAKTAAVIVSNWATTQLRCLRDGSANERAALRKGFH
jgi:hypothetical protein